MSLSKPTTTTTATAKMSDAQFTKLRQIIYERSGIHFSDMKKYVLESRLTRRLAELEMDDFDQYIMLLSIGPYREDEFQEMFNRITINETSFFRNEPQLKVFENTVLPTLLDARARTKKLRIWSAACSTGEEPYTLAIMLHRAMGIRMGEWKIEILGTDISEKALITAQSGRYANYSIRSTNRLVVSRYFHESSGFYQILPEIQKMVTFETLNLKDSLAAKRHGTWDVIFCRNVMIYFDQEMRKHCLSMFHNQLADDGTLFIGHSENIRDFTEFSARSEAQAFAYHKTSFLNKGASRVA